MRPALAALAAAAVAVAGCGAGKPSDQDQVRATLTSFSRATAAKDYQTICDKLLAPALIDDLKKIGLPCEIALQQGLGNVREPRLLVGAVTVKGKRATADVRSSAQGEAPSKDTVELVRTDAGWRISSLAKPAQATPTP